MFDNEFRYLGQNQTRSLINFAYLENDDEYGDDRYIYKINDSRTLYNTLASNSNGLIGSMINTELSYSRVSDRDYFNDFGNSLSTVSQSSVKREIRLFGETYTDENIYIYEVSSLSYQPSTTGVTEQYETAPSFKSVSYTHLRAHET